MRLKKKNYNMDMDPAKKCFKFKRSGSGSALPRLKIKNIKVSLLLKDDFPNTGIFKLKTTGAILTIYPTSKRLINVTNIKHLKHLYQLKSVIQKMYDVTIKKTRIDAIMLSRQVKGRRFSEKKYLEIFKKPEFSEVYKMDYNPERFHAPQFHSRVDGGGFFNIFSTGSCTVMGVKEVMYVKLIEQMLDKAFCKKHEIKEIT